MAVNNNRSRRRPFTSTLAVTFKRAKVTEDTEQAKLEHRGNLRILMDKYMEDVASGKAEGIKSAREFIDVVKADLLLMGEATDRTETANSVDEMRVQQINTMLDEDSPEVAALINELYESMNIANDRFGGVFKRPEDHVEGNISSEDNISEEDTEDK